MRNLPKTKICGIKISYRVHQKKLLELGEVSQSIQKITQFSGF